MGGRMGDLRINRGEIGEDLKGIEGVVGAGEILQYIFYLSTI